jgi:hypothetical protein
MRLPVADSRYAQFASSDPKGTDLAFAVWEQRVFFDGVPRRRREIVPTLAATPGMSERAARLLLLHAQVADGQPAAKPPAVWFETIETPAASYLEDDDGIDDLDDDDLDEDDEEDDLDGEDDDLRGPPNNPVPMIGCFADSEADKFLR